MSAIEDIRTFLAEKQGGHEVWSGFANYTGSQRQSLGLKADELHAFVAQLVRAYGKQMTGAEWLDLLDTLYDGQTFEEAALAGLLLGRLHAVRRALPLDRFDRWLGTLQGWAEVDTTCQNNFKPSDLLDRWDEWDAFLRALSVDANINKRRASLVLLVTPVRTSDDPRLIALALELAEHHAPERDKLIVKAVSWVLRSAIKHHREEVASFLDAHGESLAKLVVREVRGKLDTGKKG
ncbi:MAG: DNA alkylation repair protein [Chloroflexi bacterium]|nr:DNA alkylation repair protein [Chloroflexota bacterium]